MDQIQYIRINKNYCLPPKIKNSTATPNVFADSQIGPETALLGMSLSVSLILNKDFVFVPEAAKSI
jgi:hypothetical protein